MPTRALGALLAAGAAVLFVVSIVTSAWWDGHPRVDGHVFTAKDVHIGLLGGEGCNTGGTGECQPLELGATFTTAGYAELGAVGLATAFAILVAAAALRISDGRKRLAKLALVVSALAAAGAVALLVIGPEIKSTAVVEAPIGWGMLVFGGGIAASLVGSLAVMRVEREPLRLKTYARPLDVPAYDVRDLLREQHDGLRPAALGPEPMLGPGASGSLPGPAGPLGAPLVPSAPNLRPLYDMQGAVPAPIAPPLPQRAPTPIPRASAHQIAGLATPAPEFDPNASFAETADLSPRKPANAPPPPPSFVPAAAPYDSRGAAPTMDARGKAPSVAPPYDARAAAPTMDARTKAASVPPPPDARSKAPSAPPPLDRGKPKTAPPPPLRGRPASVAPFASPAIDRNASPPGPPSVTADASVDPLGKTVPAPSKPQGRPSVPLPVKIAVPKPAPAPAPTPSVVTSAAKPDAASRSSQPAIPAPRSSQPGVPAPRPSQPGVPAPRPSQPTLAHSVPPMPQIDTPPPQLRAPTDADDRLETAMRETEIVTAVEIDHEAKARFEEQQRGRAGRAETASDGEPTGVTDPPQPELPRAASEVTGDDTDAIETAGRDRVDMDANDPVAPPPAKSAPAPARFAASSAPAKSAAASSAPAGLAAAATPALAAAAAAKPGAAAAKPAEPVKPPLSTAPASLPPPKTATLPVSGPTPACPQCESPMAWVEEHLRFYCKSCRMYF